MINRGVIHERSWTQIPAYREVLGTPSERNFGPEQLGLGFFPTHMVPKAGGLHC
jgi:hypothetical protein